MARQTLNNGETLFSIRTKLNNNFQELYSLMQTISSLVVLVPTPTPTSTPTPTPTSSSTPTPTPTSTPTPTPTPAFVNPYTDVLIASDEGGIADVSFIGAVADKLFFDSEGITENDDTFNLQISVNNEVRSLIQFNGGRLNTPFGYSTAGFTTGIEFSGTFVNGTLSYVTGNMSPLPPSP
jgi:hypothetical protein